MSFDRLLEVKTIAMKAVKNGDLKKVQQLLDYQGHADIPVDQVLDADGNTLLLLAVKHKKYYIAEYLIEEKKADFNIKDKNDNNALDVAGALIDMKDSPKSSFFGISFLLVFNGAVVSKPSKNSCGILINPLKEDDIKKYIIDICITMKMKYNKRISHWYKKLEIMQQTTADWYVDTCIAAGEMDEAVDALLKCYETAIKFDSVHTYFTEDTDRITKMLAGASSFATIQKLLEKISRVTFQELLKKIVKNRVCNDRERGLVPQILYVTRWLDELPLELKNKSLTALSSQGSYEQRLIASYWLRNLKSTCEYEDGLATYTNGGNTTSSSKQTFAKIANETKDNEIKVYSQLRWASCCLRLAYYGTHAKEAKNKEITEAIKIYKDIVTKPELFSKLDHYAHEEIQHILLHLIEDNEEQAFEVALIYRIKFYQSKQQFISMPTLQTEQQVTLSRDYFLRESKEDKSIYPNLSDDNRASLLDWFAAQDFQILKNHYEVFFDFYQLELVNRERNCFAVIKKSFDICIKEGVFKRVKTCWDQAFLLIEKRFAVDENAELKNLLIHHLQSLITVAHDPRQISQAQVILRQHYKKTDPKKSLEIATQLAENKEMKGSDLLEVHLQIAQAKQQENKLDQAVLHYQSAVNAMQEKYAALQEKDVASILEILSQPALEILNQLIIIKKAMRFHENDPVHKEIERLLTLLLNSDAIKPEQKFDIVKKLNDDALLLTSETWNNLLFIVNKTHFDNVNFLELCRKTKNDTEISQAEKRKNEINTEIKKLDSQYVDDRLFRQYSQYVPHSTHREHIENNTLADVRKQIVCGNSIVVIVNRLCYSENKELLNKIIYQIINILIAKYNQTYSTDVLAQITEVFRSLTINDSITRADHLPILRAEPQFHQEFFKYQRLVLNHKELSHRIIDVSFRNLRDLWESNPNVFQEPCREFFNDLGRLCCRNGKLEFLQLAAANSYLPAVAALIRYFDNKWLKETGALNFLHQAFGLYNQNSEIAVMSLFNLSSEEIICHQEIRKKIESLPEMKKPTSPTPEDIRTAIGLSQDEYKFKDAQRVKLFHGLKIINKDFPLPKPDLLFLESVNVSEEKAPLSQQVPLPEADAPPEYLVAAVDFNQERMNRLQENNASQNEQPSQLDEKKSEIKTESAKEKVQQSEQHPIPTEATQTIHPVIGHVDNLDPSLISYSNLSVEHKNAVIARPRSPVQNVRAEGASIPSPSLANLPAEHKDAVIEQPGSAYQHVEAEGVSMPSSSRKHELPAVHAESPLSLQIEGVPSSASEELPDADPAPVRIPAISQQQHQQPDAAIESKWPTPTRTSVVIPAVHQPSSSIAPNSMISSQEQGQINISFNGFNGINGVNFSIAGTSSYTISFLEQLAPGLVSALRNGPSSNGLFSASSPSPSNQLDVQNAVLTNNQTINFS